MIGILDSGLAGLDLARRLMAAFPLHRFVYFGDTAHGPYDDKSPEAIRRWALRAARFLADQGADRILPSCHAISAVAGDLLAAEAPVPVIDLVGLTAAAAVRDSRQGRIGVMGARALIRSSAYTERIRSLAPGTVVYEAPCPLIGALIVEGWWKKPETIMIVKKSLIPLKVKKIDTLILGDAWYPVLSGIIQRKIGRQVHLVEPSAELVRLLAEGPDPLPESDPASRLSVYLSDLPPEAESRAAIFLKQRIHPLPARP